MRLADIATPALVLRRPALRRNIEALDRAAARHGVPLRPHAQAAKSIEVVRLMLDRSTAGAAPGVVPGQRASGRRVAGGQGIAVGTLAEAEYFLAHDIADILYAALLSPNKLDHVAKLNAAGAVLTVIVADPDTAAAVARHPARPRTLIALEGHEGACCGLSSDSAALVATAAALDGLFAGVVIDSEDSVAAVADAPRLAELDRLTLARAAARLNAAGHAGETLALGVPWAALPAATLTGVTELLAGQSVFGGTRFPSSEPTLSVLACVTGQRARQILVDAGSVALGGAQAGSVGVRDVAGEPAYPNAVVRRLWPERALVDVLPPHDPPPVGTLLRLLPPDPGLAAASHDRFVVVDADDRVAAVWPRVGGW